MIKEDNLQVLISAGFTELEARIYLYILKHGIVTVPEVHKALKTDKSSTYRVIENLVDKKLLTPLGEEYGQQFKVSDTDYLIRLAESKVEKTKVVLSKITDLVEEIRKDTADLYKRENISVYEGEEGFKVVMNKRLEIGTKLIREIANPSALPETTPIYWEFVEKFIKRRVEKGIHLRGLVRVEDKEQRFEQTDPELLKEVRYLPKGFRIGGTISTFGDYTSIISHKGERQLAILIKDKIISEVVNSMYDFIWESVQ